MKKWLIGIIVLVVAAAAVFFGLKTITVVKPVAIADILPQDVAFCYSIQNVETIWKNVKSSNFWKEFSDLKLWQDIQVASGIEDVKTQFKENIGIDLTEANFLKLSGQQLVVAIIPGADQNTPPKVLFLSQGKDKKSLLDIANPIMEKVKKADPAKIEEIKYEGKDITHIKAASADQPEIYFTILENVLVVGIGDTLANIQKTIDISSGKDKESLATTENYKKVTGLIGGQKNLAGLFYMDFAKMKNYLKGLTLPGPEGTETQVNTGMDTINFIGGWTEIKEGLITKLYIYPNTEALSPEMKKMWQTEAKVPETLRFVPENVLLYIVSNAINLPVIWDLWQTNLKSQAPDQVQPILDGISNFEKDWGVSITNDILPLVSNEIAFVFSDISTEGLMPLPKIALAMKVSDKDKADKLIANLIATNNRKAVEEAAKVEKLSEAAAKETPTSETAPTESATTETPVQPSFMFQINLADETYEGQTIKTLQLPLAGVGIAPGYTYIDDYLVLGITTKSLQEMIDVKKGKIKPLTQDPMYQRLTAILPKENNQASYINTERLMDIAVGVCNWIISFQQLSTPQGPAPEDPKELEAFNQQKANAEATIATIKNNVIPLIETLKAIKLVATASVNKPDHIEQILVLRVEDIK